MFSEEISRNSSVGVGEAESESQCLAAHYGFTGMAMLVDRNRREERQPVFFRGRVLAYCRCLGALGGQCLVNRPLQGLVIGRSCRPDSRERAADSCVRVPVTVCAGSAWRAG